MTDDEVKAIAETKARADAIALKLTADQRRQYVDACAPTIAKEVASALRILDQAGYAVVPKEPTPAPIKWPPVDHPHCQAGSDGECFWPHCPQAVDHQRICPLYDASREGD